MTSKFITPQVRVTRPNGIANIESVTEQSIGSYLLITMDNGHRIVIDANNLGEHECSIGVYKPGNIDLMDEDGGNDWMEHQCASVSFDNNLETKVEAIND